MLNSDRYKDLLKQWDAWIREGQAGKVAVLCRDLNHKKIPRELLVDFAQIARRVSAPELIILWLRHIIYSSKSLEKKATAAEKAIYGLGLLRLGAFGEAEKILNSVSPKEDPQVYFYKASLFINQWAYRKAIPLLRHYIKHPDVTAYQKLVGRLNLCASLVSLEKFELAETEISRLLKHLDRGGHQLLKGNLLEIRAQLFYSTGRLNEALKSLEESQSLLKHAHKMILFVNKWKILTALKSSPEDPIILENLKQLKEKSLQAKEWEIIRDIDLHLAQYQKEDSLFNKVFWGSLFSEYKKKVTRICASRRFKELLYFDWGVEEAQQTYDVVGLAPTKLLKSLFFILTREFYRPLRTTEILGLLYPENHYNASSDPVKLQRLIQRARIWLVEANIPIRIVSYRNSFKIEMLDSIKVRVWSQLPQDELIAIPAILRNQEDFTTKDWAKIQNVSRRTAQRQIQQYIHLGRIKAYSFGPKARFRFV